MANIGEIIAWLVQFLCNYFDIPFWPVLSPSPIQTHTNIHFHSFDFVIIRLIQYKKVNLKHLLLTSFFSCNMPWVFQFCKYYPLETIRTALGTRPKASKVASYSSSLNTFRGKLVWMRNGSAGPPLVTSVLFICKLMKEKLLIKKQIDKYPE